MSSEKKKLSELSKNSPRQFWKTINKYKKNKQSFINSPSLDEFKTHFMNISNTPHPSNYRNNTVDNNRNNVNVENTINVNNSNDGNDSENDENVNSFNNVNNNIVFNNDNMDNFGNDDNVNNANLFQNGNNINNENINVEFLDKNFDKDEILKVISSLKRNKSSGCDEIVADFFIDSKDFITPYLVKIFNKIYQDGVYPSAWTKGIIVPIHKKGDKLDAQNYRGITLINSMAKIFSLCLRNRLNKWCEMENVLNESQFGFRDKKSTTDCIFILHCLIQKLFYKKSKLFCAFVDYEKAFDTVIRDALWIKLIENNISCKMLTILKSLYASVSACIKISSKLSDVFDVTLGLKQGEPLSPLLFILFINDISNSLNLNDLSESDLSHLCIYLLMFADDLILFSTSPDSLQLMLDNVFEYSSKWGLKIDVNKTKVCIFEKRKQVHNEEWNINGDKIETVDNFCYLGAKFLYNGNMKLVAKSLSEQALRAMNNLMSLFTRIDLDVKTKLSLFDKMVVPIILYSSEVWGVYEYKEIDKIHIKFCKYILGVKNQTPNVAVLGELGRFPLSVLCKERAMKFWLKIKQNPGSLIHKIYQEQCDIVENNNNNLINPFWVKHVKSLLDNLGFSHLWNNFDSNINYFPVIKQRIRDQFIQNWSESIHAMSKLDYYCKYKPVFEFEEYLNIISNDLIRKNLTRLRLSSHNLAIESGRYAGIDRQLRLCEHCNYNCVESEYHFLLICPKYYELRIKYLPRVAWPTLNKYVSIMTTKNSKSLFKIAKFITEAFKLRNQIIIT